MQLPQFYQKICQFQKNQKKALKIGTDFNKNWENDLQLALVMILNVAKSWISHSIMTLKWSHFHPNDSKMTLSWPKNLTIHNERSKGMKLNGPWRRQLRKNECSLDVQFQSFEWLSCWIPVHTDPWPSTLNFVRICWTSEQGKILHLIQFIIFIYSM